MPNGKRRQPKRKRGFTLLLLLVLIAVIGIVSAGTLTLGHLAERQQAEAELLAIGDEFRAALVSYGVGPTSGPGPGAGPAELQDLLRDPRVPGVRRHLRKIYPDPLTGSTQWGLVRGVHGRIVGIYSLAPGAPVKQAAFEDRYAGFEGATGYAQWVFSALPVAPIAPGAPPASASSAVLPKR